MKQATGTIGLRRLPIGAEITRAGTHFRVWAPRRTHVEVRLFDSRMAEQGSLELDPQHQGYFAGLLPGAGAGLRYGFRLDRIGQVFPDPASRFQPDGPGGLSQLVDPLEFRWSDAAWPGVSDKGHVIYEMHIGTFTPAGTWRAAAEELPRLAELGITVLEVMPVADFPGRFGWGYDGVNMFAPTRLYGGPDDMRAFVDRAHSLQLAVILDVVYNHFGTLDNYVGQFSDAYQTDRYSNEWGGAINFDGPDAAGVREFFESNVRYWIQEFHLDGFRFDATQFIHDSSPRHILGVLSTAAREAAGDRRVLLVAENEPQHVCTVQPVATGGHGLDCIWSDDFHHAAKVRLTGRREAYYSDFYGTSDEFMATLTQGFIYQGQRSNWQRHPRGTPTRGVPATAFVQFLENHDQVANSGRGERIHQQTSPGMLRAMTALWLLAPQTPMFFQGQEYAAPSPFLFFADYTGERATAVAEGRIRFLSQFPSLASSEAQAQMAAPADPRTFEGCKLDPSERGKNAAITRLHADLLRLRRDDPIIHRLSADDLSAATIGPDALLVRYWGYNEHGDRLLLVNFGRDLDLRIIPQPLFAPPAESKWSVRWSSEAPCYGGGGTPQLETDSGWRIPRESATLLWSKRNESSGG